MQLGGEISGQGADVDLDQVICQGPCRQQQGNWEEGQQQHESGGDQGPTSSQVRHEVADVVQQGSARAEGMAEAAARTAAAGVTARTSSEEQSKSPEEGSFGLEGKGDVGGGRMKHRSELAGGEEEGAGADNTKGLPSTFAMQIREEGEEEMGEEEGRQKKAGGEGLRSERLQLKRERWQQGMGDQPQQSQQLQAKQGESAGLPLGQSRKCLLEPGPQRPPAPLPNQLAPQPHHLLSTRQQPVGPPSQPQPQPSQVPGPSHTQPQQPQIQPLAPSQPHPQPQQKPAVRHRYFSGQGPHPQPSVLPPLSYAQPPCHAHIQPGKQPRQQHDGKDTDPDHGGQQEPPKKRRGRPPKAAKQGGTTVVPKKKLGRPRKHPELSVGVKKKEMKRKGHGEHGKHSHKQHHQHHHKGGRGKRKQRRPQDEHGKPGSPAYFKLLYQRVCSQVARIRKEEHLMNVVNADGWRGASREKIKLTGELNRACKTIGRCKAKIQETVRLCDDTPGLTPIPSHHYDEEGELDNENIFCAACKSFESTDDNDIILCDGSKCGRAYHQHCVDPPVPSSLLEEKEERKEGDEEDLWWCPACICKDQVLTHLNSQFGTNYDLDTEWHEVLAQPLSGAGDLVPEADEAQRPFWGSGGDTDMEGGHGAGSEVAQEDGCWEERLEGDGYSSGEDFDYVPKHQGHKDKGGRRRRQHCNHSDSDEGKDNQGRVGDDESMSEDDWDYYPSKHKRRKSRKKGSSHSISSEEGSSNSSEGSRSDDESSSRSSSKDESSRSSSSGKSSSSSSSSGSNRDSDSDGSSSDEQRRRVRRGSIREGRGSRKRDAAAVKPHKKGGKKKEPAAGLNEACKKGGWNKEASVPHISSNDGTVAADNAVEEDSSSKDEESRPSKKERRDACTSSGDAVLGKGRERKKTEKQLRIDEEELERAARREKARGRGGRGTRGRRGGGVVGQSADGSPRSWKRIGWPPKQVSGNSSQGHREDDEEDQAVCGAGARGVSRVRGGRGRGRAGRMILGHAKVEMETCTAPAQGLAGPWSAYTGPPEDGLRCMRWFVESGDIYVPPPQKSLLVQHLLPDCQQQHDQQQEQTQLQGVAGQAQEQGQHVQKPEHLLPQHLQQVEHTQQPEGAEQAQDQLDTTLQLPQQQPEQPQQQVDQTQQRQHFLPELANAGVCTVRTTIVSSACRQAVQARRRGLVGKDSRGVGVLLGTSVQGGCHPAQRAHGARSMSPSSLVAHTLHREGLSPEGQPASVPLATSKGPPSCQLKAPPHVHPHPPSTALPSHRSPPPAQPPRLLVGSRSSGPPTNSQQRAAPDNSKLPLLPQPTHAQPSLPILNPPPPFSASAPTAPLLPQGSASVHPGQHPRVPSLSAGHKQAEVVTQAPARQTLADTGHAPPKSSSMMSTEGPTAPAQLQPRSLPPFASTHLAAGVVPTMVAVHRPSLLHSRFPALGLPALSQTAAAKAPIAAKLHSKLHSTSADPSAPKGKGRPPKTSLGSGRGAAGIKAVATSASGKRIGRPPKALVQASQVDQHGQRKGKGKEGKKQAVSQSTERGQGQKSSLAGKRKKQVQESEDSSSPSRSHKHKKARKFKKRHKHRSHKDSSDLSRSGTDYSKDSNAYASRDNSSSSDNEDSRSYRSRKGGAGKRMRRHAHNRKGSGTDYSDDSNADDSVVDKEIGRSSSINDEGERPESSGRGKPQRISSQVERSGEEGEVGRGGRTDSSSKSEDPRILHHKRRRTAVDYVALHQQMFGAVPNLSRGKEDKREGGDALKGGTGRKEEVDREEGG